MKNEKSECLLLKAEIQESALTELVNLKSRKMRGEASNSLKEQTLAAWANAYCSLGRYDELERLAASIKLD